MQGQNTITPPCPQQKDGPFTCNLWGKIKNLVLYEWKNPVLLQEQEFHSASLLSSIASSSLILKFIKLMGLVDVMSARRPKSGHEQVIQVIHCKSSLMTPSFIFSECRCDQLSLLLLHTTENTVLLCYWTCICQVLIKTAIYDTERMNEKLPQTRRHILHFSGARNHMEISDCVLKIWPTSMILANVEASEGNQYPKP